MFSDMFDGCQHNGYAHMEACDICVKSSNDAHDKWRREHPIDEVWFAEIGRQMGDAMSQKVDKEFTDMLIYMKAVEECIWLAEF